MDISTKNRIFQNSSISKSLREIKFDFDHWRKLEGWLSPPPLKSKTEIVPIMNISKCSNMSKKNGFEFEFVKIKFDQTLDS